MSEDLEKKIEAVLFTRAEPVSIRRLGEILKATESEIQTALTELENLFKDRGIVLVRKGNEVILGTAPDFSSLIESIEKEELKKELSRASMEALSIVLYKSGVTRAEIDWIRGVNSSFILRQLLIRGLVEREIHPTDSRCYVYRPTMEVIKYLGLTKLEDLPRYQEMQEILNKNSVSIESEISESTNER